MNNRALYAQVTEQMLQRSRIISMEEMNSINEGSEDTPKTLHVVFENGKEEWVQGDENIKNFVNSILATR